MGGSRELATKKGGARLPANTPPIRQLEKTIPWVVCPCPCLSLSVSLAALDVLAVASGVAADAPAASEAAGDAQLVGDAEEAAVAVPAVAVAGAAAGALVAAVGEAAVAAQIVVDAVAVVAPAAAADLAVDCLPVDWAVHSALVAPHSGARRLAGHCLEGDLAAPAEHWAAPNLDSPDAQRAAGRYARYSAFHFRERGSAARSVRSAVDYSAALRLVAHCSPADSAEHWVAYLAARHLDSPDAQRADDRYARYSAFHFRGRGSAAHSVHSAVDYSAAPHSVAHCSRADSAEHCSPAVRSAEHCLAAVTGGSNSAVADFPRSVAAA